VLVELPGAEDRQGLMDHLAVELSEAHEGLRIGVREVDHGSLPRFELKAQRVLDEREVVGATGERKAM
jgi:phenylacetate-CoA ligase